MVSDGEGARRLVAQRRIFRAYIATNATTEEKRTTAKMRKRTTANDDVDDDEDFDDDFFDARKSKRRAPARVAVPRTTILGGGPLCARWWTVLGDVVHGLLVSTRLALAPALGSIQPVVVHPV